MVSHSLESASNAHSPCDIREQAIIKNHALISEGRKPDNYVHDICTNYKLMLKIFQNNYERVYMVHDILATTIPATQIT